MKESSSVQDKIRTLERNMELIRADFGKREKNLVSEISTLQHRVNFQTEQMRSGRFRPKSDPQLDQTPDVQFLRLKLSKNRTFCGLKLVEGSSAEPLCDQGVYVAATAAYDRSITGLQPYDRLLKVNGQDLPAATEFEALMSTKEPVVVDVLRRVNPWRASTASSVTAATQTDPISSEEEEEELEPLLEKSMADERLDFLELNTDGFIDDTDIEEKCLEQLDSLEYEEVILERRSANDRVGLTLCYGSGEDLETDIFVSEIEPQSIADRDGRIREGDQILQINGVDVHTRNQAIELFTQDREQVTLLLARSTHEAMLTTGESTCGEEEPSGRRFSGFLSPMPEQQTAEEEEDGGALTDGTRDSGGSAHEKDSGISRTTDSEPELPPPIHSPSELSQISGNSVGVKGLCSLALEEHSSTTATATPTEATWNKTGSSMTTPFANGTSSALSSPGSEAPPQMVPQRMARSDSDGSLEKELACLHREMETIRLECDRLISKHATAERRVREQVQQAHCLMATMDSMSQPKKIPPPPSFAPPPCPDDYNIKPVLRVRLGATMDSPLSTPGNSRRLQKGLDDTSSAYNTGGESCRSTPLNVDNFDDHSKRKRGQKRGPVEAVTPEFFPPVSGFFPEVMYASPENVHETIQIQQRLIRQAMIHQAQQMKIDPDSRLRGSVSSTMNSQKSQNEQSEWKVKRRSDGSRYITKNRPVRNKLLRERAQKLTSERFGISTDDDAMSELKIGRFWTREERKKHMERSRERKVHQQELLRRKMILLSQAADQTIVQLSHKKMMRRKNQQLFDKFTTIQEFLAHGNKNLGTSQAMGGILSVTTV